MPRCRSARVRAGGLLVFALAVNLLGCDGRQGNQSGLPRDWFWDDDQEFAAHQKLVGRQAPPLELAGWVNGEASEKDLAGKIVVIDFWATWCTTCAATVPINNDLARRYHDKGVAVAGVCTSDSGQEQMPETAKEFGIAYPTGRDPSMSVAEAYGVTEALPTYVIVDRRGKIFAVGLRPEYLEEAVKKMMAAEPAGK